MNFVYDVLLNFNNDVYDFYDWNTDDNIMHIRKIPLFKVNSFVLSQMNNFDLKVSSEFLKRIENKTEKFTSKDAEKIKFVALFSDSNDVLALKFNENGKTIGASKLLIDENEEVLEIVKHCNEFDLKLEIFKQKKQEKFKTRKELEQKKYLNRELNKLEKNNDIEKLEYLYFECFGEKKSSLDEMINKIRNLIIQEKKTKTMCEFFKLISINNV